MSEQNEYQYSFNDYHKFNLPVWNAPQHGFYIKDIHVYSENKKYMALFYGIREVSMCNDVGKFALFQLSDFKPTLLLATKMIGIQTASFNKWFNDRYFVATASIWDNKAGRGGHPLIFVDVINCKIALSSQTQRKITGRSVSIDKDQFKICYQLYNRENVEIFKMETININKFEWFNFSEIEIMRKKYLKGKINGDFGCKVSIKTEIYLLTGAITAVGIFLKHWDGACYQFGIGLEGGCFAQYDFIEFHEEKYLTFILVYIILLILFSAIITTVVLINKILKHAYIRSKYRNITLVALMIIPLLILGSALVVVFAYNHHNCYLESCINIPLSSVISWWWSSLFSPLIIMPIFVIGVLLAYFIAYRRGKNVHKRLRRMIDKIILEESREVLK